jgi:hypothetical protein
MAAIFKPHKDAEARRRSASHLVKLLLQHDPEILPAHRAEAMSLLGRPGAVGRKSYFSGTWRDGDFSTFESGVNLPAPLEEASSFHNRIGYKSVAFRISLREA